MSFEVSLNINSSFVFRYFINSSLGALTILPSILDASVEEDSVEVMMVGRSVASRAKSQGGN